MSPDVELSPTGGVELPDPPEAQTQALKQALAADEKAAIAKVAARYPEFTAAWAALGDWALAEGNTVEAYAYYRVGYHRSLDALRKNGWRGAGRVPFDHEPNRAFHQATFGLMRASDAFGDFAEAERAKQLLLDSDPSDPLGAATA